MQHTQDMPPKLPSPLLILPPTGLSSLPLTILMLLQHPQDVTEMPPPHLCPHHSLPFHTPTTYHLYTPAEPSRYSYNATTSSPRSPILLIFSTAYYPYTPILDPYGTVDFECT
ncbi:hypothetical protein O181_104132 [Austropuccinia psidii MF-1]|uniref:Uncharacterized protein n=1 Tax=Austropuccinia psidii MF-1 TaxID=1389203 RepID=A0A9Q3JL29_9BASI|nr:hypothetical protein [Austropuccinia psidii MF-1]